MPLMFARSPALSGDVEASFSGSNSAKIACIIAFEVVVLVRIGQRIGSDLDDARSWYGDLCFKLQEMLVQLVTGLGGSGGLQFKYSHPTGCT